MVFRIIGGAACLMVASACATPADNTPPLELEATDLSEILPSNTNTAETPPALEDLIWAADALGLKHVPSGAICPISVGPFTFTSEDIFPGLPTGDDVVCFYEAPDEATIRLYFTNFGRTVSTEAHLKSIDSQIKEVFGVEGLAPTPISNDGAQITLSHSAYQLRQKDPAEPKRLTATWIERLGLWHVKVRANYGPTRTDAVGRAVGDLFSLARRSIPGDDA